MKIGTALAFTASIILIFQSGASSRQQDLARRGGMLSQLAGNPIRQPDVVNEQGPPAPPWWSEYAPYRGQGYQHFFDGNRLDLKLLGMFRTRLRDMDSVRRRVCDQDVLGTAGKAEELTSRDPVAESFHRAALLYTPLTSIERQTVSQPFHNYDWLTSKAPREDDKVLATEMVLQDLKRLTELQVILERYRPGV